MSLNSDTLSRPLTIQCLFLLINASCLPNKQEILLKSLRFDPTGQYRTRRGENTNHYTRDTVIIMMWIASFYQKKFIDYTNISILSIMNILNWFRYFEIIYVTQQRMIIVFYVILRYCNIYYM
jgi:hypothetical protein